MIRAIDNFISGVVMAMADLIVKISVKTFLSLFTIVLYFCLFILEICHQLYLLMSAMIIALSGIWNESWREEDEMQ